MENSAAHRITVLLSAVALCALSISGCFLIPEEKEELAPPLVKAPEVTYDVIELIPRNLLKKVSMSGIIAPVTEERLFFRYQGGRIVHLYVEYGDEINRGEVVAELNNADLEDQVELRRIGLTRAELQMDKLRSSGAGKIDVELAALAVREARIRLQTAMRRLNDSRLLSPVTGPVTYIGPEEGEYVEPFQVVAVVVDPTELILECSSDKAKDFPRGSEVDVDFGDQERTGTVVGNPLDNPDPEHTIDPREDRVYIRVDEMPVDAKMGDPVVVSRVLARREDTLVVPKHVLKSHSGRTYVNVLVDGLKEERDVRTGIETATEVEIAEGLQAGDLVIAR